MAAFDHPFSIADLPLPPQIYLSTYRCSSRQAAVVFLSDERLAGEKLKL